MHWRTFFSRIPVFLKQLFLRKPLEVVESETHYNQTLRRSVTPLQMVGLGVGGIIGELDCILFSPLQIHLYILI